MLRCKSERRSVMPRYLLEQIGELYKMEIHILLYIYAL